VEGLSYLTLDADVKEKLCEDEEAFKALLALAEDGKSDAAYAVAATLVNICNAFDKQEIEPEMLELAKFAKHHIPQVIWSHIWSQLVTVHNIGTRVGRSRLRGQANLRMLSTEVPYFLMP